jgi:UDP-N-acetylmuramate-alanine ligase
VHVGHRAENLGEAQVVVTSTAIKKDNPEVVAARGATCRSCAGPKCWPS